MGHMLKTTNPQAAAAIGHEVELPMPGVGEMVLYRPRVGEQRAGRLEFPAMVMGLRDGGGQALDLLVFYDADDQIMRERVLRATDKEPFNAWSMSPRNVMVEPFEPSRLNGMTVELAKLKAHVLGDFADPPAPIMEILDGFGRRLKALEKSLSNGVSARKGRSSK